MSPCKKYGHTEGRYTTGGCKRCAIMGAKRRYEATPEAAKARIRKWQIDNRKRHNESARAWRRKRVGLPTPTRPESSVCEICSRPPGKKSLHLDHCHTSGRFRGWLCSSCNFMLGLSKDNPDVLTKAANYLLKCPLDCQATTL